MYFAASKAFYTSHLLERPLGCRNTRDPIDVVTGKRIYRNMLIKAISETTDKTTDKVLSIKMDLQEIILVAVSTVKIPASSQKKAAQKEPKRTGQTENGGREKESQRIQPRLQNHNQDTSGKEKKQKKTTIQDREH